MGMTKKLLLLDVMHCMCLGVVKKNIKILMLMSLFLLLLMTVVLLNIVDHLFIRVSKTLLPDSGRKHAGYVIPVIYEHLINS